MERLPSQNLDRIDEMKHQEHKSEKPFTIVRRPGVWCLWLVTAAYKNVSVQFVFWSLGIA